MSPPLIETRNVERRFRFGGGLFEQGRDLRAVNGVSLAVRKGEVLGIVGESGCGKWTLARMLLGLLAPSAGEILFDGQAVAQPRAALRWRGACSRCSRTRIPRSIRARPSAPSSSLPLPVHRIGAAQDAGAAEVERMMELVGLPKRLHDAYPGQLSGGQRQRVAIARALVMRPEAVICDEPTSALDVSVQAQILNLLQDLQREFGLTYDPDQPQPRGGRAHGDAGRGDVSRPHRRGERHRGAVSRAAPSLHAGAAASVLTPEPGLGVPDAQLGVAFPNPLDPPPGCPFHPRCPSSHGPLRHHAAAADGARRRARRVPPACGRCRRGARPAYLMRSQLSDLSLDELAGR